METQTTFRLPAPLFRLLVQKAGERGVSKSQLVREALEQYLGAVDLNAAAVRERTASYLGALRLDPKRRSADPAARLIRDHNWRR